MKRRQKDGDDGGGTSEWAGMTNWVRMNGNNTNEEDGKPALLTRELAREREREQDKHGNRNKWRRC